MSKRRCTFGVSLAVLVGSAVLAMTMYRQAAARSGDATEFFRVRRATYSLLQERLAASLEGVRIPDRVENMPSAFPGESHIQSVVRDMDWSNTSSFQLRINLQDSALPPAKQGDSETMAAALLLNHYFAPVEELGFRRVESGGTIGDMVQSARKMWISDEARSIVVEGSVFVALASNEAIVQGVIHERLDRQ